MRSLFLFLLILLPEIRSEASLEDWPEEWVSAYSRFQNFIESREMSVRSWKYILDSENRVQSVMLPDKIEKGKVGYGLRFFYAGVSIPRKAGWPPKLTPGDYLVLVRGVGPFGYQHLGPMIKVRVEEEAEEKTH